MSDERKSSGDEASKERSGRRDFLANAFMGAGLAISHLFAAGLALRYLYPTRQAGEQRLFVGLRSEMPPGTALAYEAPGGKTINIVRSSRGFIALSDVCPHLGCRVHFEAQDEQFLCPCHDGRFDADGKPVSGPPAEMGAALPQYEVHEDGDMVFLIMAVEG